jgi:hypothetical protein
MPLAQIDFKTLENSTGDFAFAGGDIASIFNKVLPYVFAFAGVLLFLYLIAGGFSYMTSAGDPKKAKEAQSKITNALVGIILVLLAYILVQLVGKIFGLVPFANIFG